MGVMTFRLPAGISKEAASELKDVWLAGGPDNMPWPTTVKHLPGLIQLTRSIEDSGHLTAPWNIAGVGQLMCSSATLMERPRPYSMLIELARGKVNQVRNQAIDWEAGGLQLDSAILQKLQAATRAFSMVATLSAGTDGTALAEQALQTVHHAADELVRTYTTQVFQLRQARQPRLDTTLSCRLGGVLPTAAMGDALLPAFNRVNVPISWGIVEEEEAVYRWESVDTHLKWALDQGFQVTAGPLIDFSASQVPPWVRVWDRNLPSLSSFMSRFVESAVRRYGNRVRRWQLTAASNWGMGLGLGEDELLGLTYRLTDAARQADPTLELLLGVAQPWGEYMASAEHEYSPFLFADHLIRSGLVLSALEVEVVMGIGPRGSYCRDPLEMSRLLDLYALLGVPLHVTLGFPSASDADPEADASLSVSGGRWGAGFTPETQAAWAAAFAGLALCKPYVTGVTWAQASDRGPHLWPHVGLFDRADQPKPALAALRELRELHLR